MSTASRRSLKTAAGIQASGAYVPLYRLSRDTIGVAWGTRSTGGERSVANFDEDAVTMAVEAARDCLRGIDRGSIGGLYFASTTAPYLEKGSATLIAKALNLQRQVLTADFAHSLRSGTSALLAALAVVESGRAERVLVVAADCRLGYPRSDSEQLFGDAAAAVLVGRDGIVASVDDAVYHADEIHDAWRRDVDPFVRSWEARFTFEEGYMANMREALEALMERGRMVPADVAKLVLYTPDPRSADRLAQALGFDRKTQLQRGLIDTVGCSGSAQVLLLLAAALEEAEKGSRIVVGSYGDGAEALVLTVAAPSPSTGGSVQAQLAGRRPLPSYERYASFRGIVPVRPEQRLRVYDFSGAPITWRERDSFLSMLGSQCNQCGITSFPIQRVCYECRSLDDFTTVSLADAPASIFTYSLDHLAGTLEPPVMKVVLESQMKKTRINCTLTDCDASAVAVEMPVEMTFRRLHEGAEMHHYTWKARPVRNMGEGPLAETAAAVKANA